MNRDDAQEGLMEFSRIVRLFASRIISRRHVEREKKGDWKKEKRKGKKKQRSWQREYVPRFLSRGIS